MGVVRSLRLAERSNVGIGSLGRFELQLLLPHLIFDLLLLTLNRSTNALANAFCKAPSSPARL